MNLTNCLSILWMSVALPAAEVEFAERPRVAQHDGQVTISFALSQATDVEVAVLNADARVVRHLAAGVLGGERTPPQPLQPGLKQSLVWDGRDDLSRPALGGPFRVQVRVGMQVKFGRMIGGSPYTGSVVQMPYRAPVNGLALDSEGNLYVKMMSSVGSHGNSGMWPWHVRKFDREGNYVKTILPYPPSMRRDRTSGFKLLETRGAFTPANQNSLYPVFATLGNEIIHRVIGGQLVFVHSEQRQLNFFALDGTNRLRTLTMWPDEVKLNCPRWLDIQVAISPDGRYAYYSNVAGTAYDGKRPADIDPRWPQGRVYRQDLSGPDSVPQPWFDLELPDFEGRSYWMPSAWDKKTATAGIDTDNQGNVLVCDLVGGQVVEIDTEGNRRSATAVPWPDKVMVSRKSGHLYVISRKVSRGVLPPATLRKIEGRGERAKVVAELQVAGTVGGAYALDESGDVAVLWLAGSTPEGEKLLRAEDHGDRLAVTGEDFLNRDPSAITFVGYMDVDRQAELVYVTRSGGTVWRFDGRTGQGGPLEIKAVDLAVGPGGRVYTWGVDGRYAGPIARYTRRLEPAPLESTGRNTYGYLYGRAGRGCSVCGLDVDAKGRVFATYGSNECHVRAYDAEGELVDFQRKITLDTPRGPQTVPVAVAGVVGYGGSIRLDTAGNIYLLQQGLPEDHQPPPGYENDPAYRLAVGTIYKFPSSGGRITLGDWSVKRAAGAVAAYPGCGPVSRWRAVGACACTKPRFDVDEFGRLYIP
ncbi:MAG: NHL repeat-containing protein, partial [Planctomycetota bacterium]